MHLPTVLKYIETLKHVKNNLIMAPTGNLGIPRSSMPQIDGKHREDFVDWIKSQGVKVRDVRVPAKSLKLAQGEYNRDKVGEIVASGSTGNAPIFVSKDGYVVDGNHRLIAHLNMPGSGKYLQVTELGLDIKSLLELISQYPNVRYRNLNNV